MGEPSTDSLHDVYEDQLSAARYKAERDAAVQELQAMRERNIELWMESGMANELATCAEDKAERLGKLVWRLQNRLARSHRREKALRKGMRMWREKAISGPVRTVSAYDLLPEEDLQALRWVREQGGLNVLKVYTDFFENLLRECREYRDLVRDYEKRGGYGQPSVKVGATWHHASDLTHAKPEPPDSWEKWREEFIKPPCVYCRDILGVEFDNDTELDKAFDAQIQDMEHRARALAERGE